MPDSFMIFTGNYDDVNLSLRASVQKMDQEMSDLGQTLANIGVATSGLATPIWEGLAKEWTAAYIEIQNDLNIHTNNSVAVGETFKTGNRDTARAITG
ncbi:hypothetical protein KIH74_14705 [Kineosporia sp. J2-2]|uniref:WXG100 family type VII secretion target n=1 Tax=Kineosporia corallincola TaxID=2835133 RepID=A0ABS5TJE5_9ACTN|nr:hypothetical protein [Kineosporia corallincola]MBT0770188.1 hypothetical protein [Kineosporia corallincola]